MNKFRLGSVMLVLVPLVAALTIALLCMNQYKQRDMAQQQQSQAQAQVASLNNMLQEADATPLIDKDIALEGTPDEQAEFLTQLRLNAQAANVKLVQYMNMGPVAPPPAPNGQAPAPSAAPAEQYTPVASTLTVQGAYPGIRAFAYSLLRARRLMTMNGVTWKRDADSNSTTLSFTLIRYTMPPATHVVTTTVSPSPAGASGGAIQ